MRREARDGVGYKVQVAEFRSRSSTVESWPSTPSTMASAPDSPAKSKGRDTGFPDHFCGDRNTTLPHPEADLSGHACITSEDDPLARVYSRQRKQHLLHRYSHKRTVKSGILSPSGMFSDRSPFSGTASIASSTEIAKVAIPRNCDSSGSGSDESPVPPQGLTESAHRPPPDDNMFEDSVRHKHRHLRKQEPQEYKRRSFFGRLVHHD
ncbi:hypothetical protein P8C59_002953 [Phyllachora maydis]|uniref:Uncharacterized protein n=1 Tax=Phyllachora maydis TaxID=1825666 RepID=A0AAD9MAX9_9PEZI|nr:hypothetical protein P8C59_002953 [Phyllachora maydis]